MPNEQQMPPSPQPIQAASRMPMVVGLSITAIVLAGAAYVLFFSDLLPQPNQQPSASLDIMQAMRAGDYESASARYEAVVNNPEATALAKARAAYASFGSEYRITADPAARLSDVRKMKEIILDETLPVSLRVNTLNLLAGQYAISGSDAAVNEEIFKDPPFSAYKQDAQYPDLAARLSAKKLFEWSYSIAPTSYAAISIARGYSEQRLFDSTLTAEQVRKYNDLTEDYLNKADAAAIEEAKADSNFLNSTSYLSYRHWRAVIIGRLAAPSGERGQKYKALYRQEFDEFIDFTNTQKNVLAADFRLYSRLFYGRYLVREGELADAKVQLDTLAAEMRAVENKNVNVFLRFLQNEYKNRPTGATWISLVQNQFEYSSAFKAAVESTLAGTL